MGGMGREQLRSNQVDRTQSAQPVAGSARRGRVTRDCAAITDPVKVGLVDGNDQILQEDTAVSWEPRSTLPAAGDECLVIYDADSRPWIVKWATVGGQPI